ncbi:MAG TPA: FtsW/RodA/SpoVE family cell cycle protein [Gemmatimonadaceae bacterium]|jgi:cell division protein FtsW|nr:FtsW/RodA/SpoVE family cell cycle protein [Gemmatimonadaceae bacterium]
MSVEARALVLVTGVLLAFGLVVVYSASFVLAAEHHLGSSYYFTRQLEGVLLGIIVFAVAAKTDTERWTKWAWPLMLVTLALMVVTILPFTVSLAPRIHGARRFLFGASIQPSEIAKLAVVMWTAALIVKKGDQLRHLTTGFFPFLVVVGALDVLAAVEPDLSVAMIYTFVMAVVLFAGGVRIGHFIVLGVLSVPVLWHEGGRLRYVAERVAAFRHLTSAARTINYQLLQSLIAVGSGGLVGVGLGNGRQQYGFVPFPYDDFVGSVIGEEWGFLGLLLIVVAFAAYGWLGFRIARVARTPFQQLVAVGLTITTLITAYLHIGVVIGLLPTTGLTLPFISYGRSNLVLSLLMTGILVNIGSVRERVIGAQATDPTAP